MEQLPQTPNNTPVKANDVSMMIHGGQKTKAIDIRRKLINVPEVAAALSPVERNVFVASTKKQIKEIPDPDLIDITAKTFKFIAKDIGYNIPNDNSEWVYICARLMGILKTYFSNLTISDVKLAFELLAVGELDEHLPRDSKGNPDKHHYQNFNAEYLGKIIRAYRKKQTAIINKAYKALPEPERNTTDQEKNRYHNKMIADLIHAFLHYKYRGELPDSINEISVMLFYQELQKVGLAVDFQVTEEEKKQALSRIYFMGINHWDARQIEKQGIEHEKVKREAFTMSRRNALIQAFDNMINEGLFIYNYIKFKK